MVMVVYLIFILDVACDVKEVSGFFLFLFLLGIVFDGIIWRY